jgi:hypothetical protein
MEEDDKVYICCSRVNDPPKIIIEGSTKERCTACSEEVWISPSTLKTKEERQGVILCLPCAKEKASKSSTPPKVEISPKQLDEIVWRLHTEIHMRIKDVWQN